MPPGPPTSPVPSPPHSSTLTVDLVPDFSDDVVSYNPTANPSTEKRLPNLTAALCTRLRRRRNAICAHSTLGQGLKDFFASYVMSHLTDSMTSSLNLDSNTEVGTLDTASGSTGCSHLTLRSRLSCSPPTLSPFSNNTETSME
ncbi:unnamed protein product [Echinostoma caproni]|uniref:Uncharacterized protein n=1 Tax=Echinostoma caproni TaxID=27848 RepID=A0A183AZS2_9TREM|nr:unnamed protein product [Echinostoma caproni]